MERSVLTYVALAALISSGVSGCAMAQNDDTSHELIAITGVSVVDASRGSIAGRQTVLIAGDRITDVGAVESVSVPESAEILDGSGLYAVPGIADMHVHLSEVDLPAYLDHGVTTVRNLWGYPDLQDLMEDVAEGRRDGPLIYAMSPGLDAAPAYWPYTQFVEQPEDAGHVVRAQADAGWRTLKLYADLRRDAYDAIVQEARSLGLDFGGHVSPDVGIEHALESGHRFVEHLSGYDMVLNPAGARGAAAWKTIDASRIEPVVKATVESGAWNCPTLAIFKLLARGDARIVENRRTFVGQLFEAGAPLLAGTDSGIGQTMPGRSIHDELDEFVASGIPDAAVLRIATTEAARFLGEEDEFGKISAGFRADILLVETNPLQDISALRAPLAVIARGRRVR